jgi:hypothetical protein
MTASPTNFSTVPPRLDLLPEAGMVGTYPSAHVLRVLLLGGCGEADQVTEEDGDDLPLLEHGWQRLLGERCRA